MKSVLDRINDALQELCSERSVPMVDVWYGACQAEHLPLWNYFVFNRKKTTKANNGRDLQTQYEVHIIHEDYIPEGYVETVIDKIESIYGCKLRQTEDDVTYNYTFKGNTNMVVEMATITFYKPQKRC